MKFYTHTNSKTPKRRKAHLKKEESYPQQAEASKQAEASQQAPSNGAPVLQHRKIQALGSEMSQANRSSQERLHKKELALWITFFILLAAVLFFSQRNWLSKIFPVQKHPQLHLSVQVLRKNIPDPTQEPKLHFAEAPNTTEESKNSLLQQFDHLLRLDKDDTAETSAIEGATRDVRLFFIKIEADGQLQLTGALHKVPFDKTPLSQTLERLLKGPETQEINKGLHSMLPPDMQILRIRVVGDTVFLDLSEELYSIVHLPAVLLAAVEQLVFTVTEFPTVKSLRLLVEGQPIFPENLPESTSEYLLERSINLNSDLRRENLWQKY